MENTFALARGRHTKQAHVALPEGCYEDEQGRDGFFGRVSHLYRAHRPTDWFRIEGPLRPRAFNLLALHPADEVEARGLPLPVLENSDVRILISRRRRAMPYAFRNGDADELHFVHQGHGVMETDYGPLPYEPGDYLVLPKGTAYRMRPADEAHFVLIVESPGEFEVPDRGMLGRHALFDPATPTIPEPQPSLAEGGAWELMIQRGGRTTSVWYPFDPLDAVGWKGDLTAWKINVRDIRPVLSHRYHLPPSAHTFLKSRGFVVCTFLPRPIEEDPEALKVPFFHQNVDYDEVLFYHDGDFFSRDHIEAGMMTLHPAGLHHGPHPKALANQGKRARTDEVAVMIDAKQAFQVCPEALAAENAAYWASWGAKEAAARAGEPFPGEEA